MYVACHITKHLCVLAPVQPEASLLLPVISLLDGHSLVKVLCGTKLPTAIIIADYPLKTWLMPYKLILHPYPLPLFMVII